ncbi:methionine gamma-lyase [Bacillus xiapuensis]|uniref:methionine gamma-lyase n=1 Tax=Bacillus xiapuensis TaxID=2014075 RepID=UPI000C23B5AB|nr:methionine gamma-lyase [Bacillus xiapuensis]
MAKSLKNMETAVIHAGYNAKDHAGSLATPIYQTSTFIFDNAEQGERRFAGEEEGYIYSRLGNPTVRALEERMAELEDAEAALAFSSGMAAVSAVLLAMTKAEDHIICSQGVYGCTFSLLEWMEANHQISFELCAMETEEQIQQMIRPDTACIYVETPINPTMKLIDLEMVTQAASQHGIPVVVDNTFSSPYLQRPLTTGCDVVVHSATKYISGHGDVVAGIAAGSSKWINQIAQSTLKDIGGVISPFDAWLLLRGLKTLPIRMDRHCENAAYIAQQLKKHSLVQNVHYPGDQDHADYRIMKKQMKKGGGLISFELDGTKEQVQKFLNELSLIRIAVSLGDAETLIQHPATMTHSAVPEEMRSKMGITDQLIRLSVGLEAKQDIWQDLERALNAFQKG